MANRKNPRFMATEKRIKILFNTGSSREGGEPGDLKHLTRLDHLKKRQLVETRIQREITPIR
jgi:hypothetical protein